MNIAQNLVTFKSKLFTYIRLHAKHIEGVSVIFIKDEYLAIKLHKTVVIMYTDLDESKYGTTSILPHLYYFYLTHLFMHFMLLLFYFACQVCCSRINSAKF